MKMLLLLTFLFLVNVGIALATSTHVSTFVAGLVGGLLVSDICKFLNRGDRR